MTLTEAINAIGASRAAQLTGLERTTLLYWRDQGKAPKWRERDVKKLLRLAEQIKREAAK